MLDPPRVTPQFSTMDIAVVVNLRARRGSEAVAKRVRAALPNARVLASNSLDESLDFARELSKAPPSLLVSAGGDGTAVALVNALREISPDSMGSDVDPRMLLGVLPLGTGNAWARVTGAKEWRSALARLGTIAHSSSPLPRKRFDLVEVEGQLAHFAGTGWDAEMIDDFHAQKTGFGVLPKSRRNGLAGYLQGMFLHTVPRHLFHPVAEVELTNTGADALTVDEHGAIVKVPGGEHGKVLYRGPTSVCAAGTTQQWGMDFVAFPYAGLVPGRMCFRIYAGNSLEATMRMGKLWRGEPVAKMHSWLLTKCHARFSRPLAFQIGGDRLGHREDVEYSVASERIDLLDWGQLHLADACWISVARATAPRRCPRSRRRSRR
jgi:diacylglycerol kinase family enzyme